MNINRVVIIGLDGVPYGLIDAFARGGIMPETKKMIENGTFLQMESSLPEISSVAWSSIITGKNPGEHGIFGYTDIPIGTYRLSFPNFNNLKSPPFWQLGPEKTSIIINVPSTFPVKPMNGIHISGFVSIDLKRSVFPETLIQKLIDLDYRIDVDSSKAHESIEMFLNDLNRTLHGRINAYKYLWGHRDWQTFMLVFTGTDRLSHFLWDAYEDESHRYHSAFLDHFSQIDQVIGEIAGRISENDLLVIISDHGFELLENDVNINHLLREEGYLHLKSGSRRTYADMEPKTVAFALEPARIYIHSKNKYPRGSVEKSEYDNIVDELITLFDAMEKDGEKVIQRTIRKKEAYQGAYLDLAPDLVLIPRKGFNLKASVKANTLYDKGIFTGKHTQHDAFFYVNRNFPKEVIPDKLSVSDVYRMIETAKKF
jgi:predicted AlkP superfamily phosphohydrolase/phosphomutase